MNQTSPGADRGEQTGMSQDMAGDGPIGTGPFDKDLHRTPVVLWWSVALMSLGAALIGGAIIAFNLNDTIGVELLVAGVAVGLIGVVVGLKNKIMGNVD